MLKPFLYLSILLLCCSCVSTKKYKILESENLDQSKRIEKLEYARERGEISAQDLINTENQLKKTETLLLNVNSNYNGLKESYNTLEKSYEEILLQNSELLEVTSKEKANLTDQLNKKQEALDFQENVLEEREGKIKESEAKIENLEQLLNSEKLKMDTLQNSISSALFAFGTSDLSVEQKEGKIYVSLSQKLLFSKGSTSIDQKGKDAIIKLAEVLREINDINVVVEGHTDPDGNPELNWDLSTKRATSVVKLLQKSGVDPSILTAAGRALYDPIAENDTEANKGKNRRTEIILSPKLDQILDLIRSN